MCSLILCGLQLSQLCHHISRDFHCLKKRNPFNLSLFISHHIKGDFHCLKKIIFFNLSLFISIVWKKINPFSLSLFISLTFASKSYNWSMLNASVFRSWKKFNFFATKVPLFLQEKFLAVCICVSQLCNHSKNFSPLTP